MVRFPNPDAVGLRRDQAAAGQVLGVVREDGEAEGQFEGGREFDQADDPAVGFPFPHGQGAEILVASEDDALLGTGGLQDFPVSRIFLPVAHKIHVMSAQAEGGSQTPARAGIDEQLHRTPSASTGSVRSLPTIRLA